MSEWWKKLMGILRGEEGDGPPGLANHSAPAASRSFVPGVNRADDPERGRVAGDWEFASKEWSPPAKKAVDAPPAGDVKPDAQAPRRSITMPADDFRIHSKPVVADPGSAGGWGAQLNGRIDRLCDLIEQQQQASDAVDGRVASLLGAVDERLAAQEAHLRALSAAVREVGERAGHASTTGVSVDGQLSTVIDKTLAAEEDLHRIREMVATLPEIVQTQLDALNGLHERLEPMTAHIDASIEAMNRHAAAYDEIRAVVGEIKSSIAEIQDCISSGQESLAKAARTDAELANRQQQIAKALNVLRQMSEAGGQAVAGVTGAIERLKAELDAGARETRAQVARATGRLSTRATAAMIFSILAAAAAAAAVVLPFIR